MSAAAVDLRPFDPVADRALVAGWLAQPDVHRWWGEPDATLAELTDRPPGTAALIVWAGRPVGVLAWQTPTRAELAAAGLDDLPVDLVDVDVMIGERDARGRGVAAAALHLWCAARRAEGVRLVGLAAATANDPALAAYAKAGFAPYRDFVENGEGYRYLTRDLHVRG